MSIKEKLTEDMKTAMKAKDALKLSTIRMVTSAIKNKEIDLRHPLTDGEVEAVIGTAIKQRRDSAEQYRAGGRNELAEKEEAEIVILMTYLPEQLSEEQVKNLVAEAIAETQASGANDMGKVMKALMPKTKGKADGAVVNRLVKEALGG
ncbi:MAG: GatB/YqeY domain-containing protein [Nitrospinae bacterium]|nr:GatB/YqeY domain-containing protein [Nitrospinota bacterium]